MYVQMKKLSPKGKKAWYHLVGQRSIGKKSVISLSLWLTKEILDQALICFLLFQRKPSFIPPAILHQFNLCFFHFLILLWRIGSAFETSLTGTNLLTWFLLKRHSDLLDSLGISSFKNSVAMDKENYQMISLICGL